MASDFQHLGSYLWVKQHSPYATNTGLLIRDHQVCLIDPGISSVQLIKIQHFVTRQDAEVHTIIFTHAHWDHLLGAALFPNARVIAHGKITWMSSETTDLIFRSRLRPGVGQPYQCQVCGPRPHPQLLSHRNWCCLLLEYRCV